MTFTPVSLLRFVFLVPLLWLATPTSAHTGIGAVPPVAEFSGTPLAGSAPLLANFTDLSTGNVTTWAWTFGDGGTSTLQNPTHAYVAAGTYTVALTVSGSEGADTMTKTDYIQVGLPTADFTGTPLSGAAPLAVTFSDASSGAVTSWAWSFGDGGTSTLQNPTHTYTTPGTYGVTLLATGPGGSDPENKPAYVTVTSGAPTADFTGTPLSGVAPLSVNFTDATSGVVTAWAWTFGDGGTSNLQNPSHTYAAAGTYTVALTSTGPGGSDTNTKASYVTVAEPPPVADFSATPLSGVAPLSVNFTDATSGVVTAWAWTFGDGGTSNLQNPSHTYAAAGTYTVALTSTGPGGSDTNTKASYVTVAEPPPVADFSATPLSGVAPLSVNFTDATSGVVTAWAWTFGDGGTSNLQNPSHTYAAAGTYTVALTSTGPGGSDTNTKASYVTVAEPPPVADFSATPLSGVAPLSVNFTDATSGVVTAWAWTFGDGGTSNLQNPSHTYAAAGTYTVALTSTGPGGSDTNTKAGYVTVTSGAPTADFTGTPLSGVAPLSVNFTDATSGVVTAWAWTFGDGGTSNLQNPSHTYAAAGTYTVALTSTGPGGSDTNTKAGYVTVTEPPPVAAFSGTPTSGPAPLSVSFTDASTGAITSGMWDFGDGGTSTVINATYIYTTPGTYTVTLTLTGPGGMDSEVKPGYITVTAGPPTADFSGTPLSGTAPLSVGFSDLTSGAVTAWAWTFGDGGSSSLQNPSHTYGAPGTYTVALTSTGPGGNDTNTKAGYVSVGDPPPVPDFSGTPLAGVRPLAVGFTDATTGAVTSWSWSFGDGGSSTLQNPTHTYLAAGTYTVALTATGTGGSNTETKANYVTVDEQPPVADFSGAPLSGVEPLNVAFSDLTTGAVSAWSWSFGDGGSSTLQNPSHTYAAAGTYTVALTATGRGGSDVDTKVDYISVSSAPPTAEFSASPSGGPAPLVSNFTDLSAGTVTSWSWTFGDGGTSTLQNPSHTYTALGTYTVSLSVTGPGGSDGETKPDFIVVIDSLPDAEFLGTPTLGVTPLDVSFTDFTTGLVTAWAWDFGDGGTSILQNPVHTYSVAGTYTVSLTASNAGGGNVETKTNYVTVGVGPPVVDFSGAPTTGVAPLSVSFSEQASGVVTTWLWDFGDLGTSSQPNPTHVFTTPGTYTVSLTATGPGGAGSTSKTDYVVVLNPPPAAQFSGSPLTGVSPLTVSFTDLSTGDVSGWDWSFGDAETSTAQNPIHVYTSPGTYSVALTANGAGGSDTETKAGYVVVLNPPPSADFVGSPRSGPAPLNVSFTDFTSGNVTAWAWTFGDGGTSSAPDPNHVYSTPGSYTVALTATGPGGSTTRTKVDYVIVAEPAPVSDFTGSPTSGVTPLDVTFSDTSSGMITGWSWSFGDGGTSTAPSPTHTYSAAGTYTVSLTTIGPGGSNTETKVDYVSAVEPAPVAQFSATPLSGQAPHLIGFSDFSTGTVTSFLWDFGDGSTSASSSPLHTYSNVGTYTVSLTVTGPMGTDTETKTDYVTVTEPAPVAQFFGTPLFGVGTLDVSFNDQSSNVVTSWFWDFGDLSGSSLENPSHTYSEPGTYTVSLTVTGPGGVSTERKNDYVVVAEPPPIAEFSAAPRSGATPLPVTFADFSVGNVTSWLWTFGDSNTSTEQNPTHIYTAVGTYSVSLTVVSAGGLDTETKVSYITVGEARPTAGFSATPRDGDAPLSVAFTDLTTGNVTSYLWDFGDLSTSTLQNPAHTYTETGVFTVTLTATGPGGISTRVRPGFITVDPPPPTAEFSGTPTTGIAPLLTSFTDMTTGDVDTWSWDFGDGATSSLQNPSHTYAAAGTYTVSLVATGPGGLGTRTRADYVVVDEAPPVAEFSGTPTSGVAPLSVEFSDFSTGAATAWSWDFGDGSVSNLQSPTHVYTTVGTYSVTLTTTGPGGMDSEPKADYVRVETPPPVAGFTATPLVGIAPLTVGFFDLSTGDATAYSWEFGDLSTSTLQNPVHVFTEPGTYTVQLRAVGPGGTDTEVKVDYITVNEPPPTAQFSGFPRSGVAPLDVDFSDFSSGNVTNWNWTFGDGSSSGDPSPSHTYTTSGLFTVSLTVTSPGGGDTETKSGYIFVQPSAPTANFVASQRTGGAPVSIGFTDLSSGDVNAWQWSFGDLGTSTLQNPTHTYTTPGTYNVSLTVSGANGIDTRTRAGYIVISDRIKTMTTDDPTVTVSPPDEPDFFGLPRVGPAPLTVEFFNMSRGVWNRSIWTFGDGTGSNRGNPVKTYNTPGTYDVVLEVRRAFGAEVAFETKVGYIVVTAPLVGIEGGSFEGHQADFGAPGPWQPTLGGHARIQPDGLAADQGMPTHGARWAELDASGTAHGATTGIDQAFEFNPDLPHLAFEAAFLRGGAAEVADRNDFLVVEVSDGASRHEAYRVDTFADFPRISDRYGLPMTEVSTVVVDLAELFPDAEAGQALTVSARIGNGGPDEDPSIGYLDHFRLLARASSETRAGGGQNLDCYRASVATPGELWHARVDPSAIEEATGILVLGTAQPSFGRFLAGGGELLVDPASPHLFALATMTTGGLEQLSTVIPDDPALAGQRVFTQAFLSDANGAVFPCEAVDLILGF